MKRRFADIIFLCKLEKFEKYFPVNWGIIIEYFYNKILPMEIGEGDCILLILSICIPNLFI